MIQKMTVISLILSLVYSLTYCTKDPAGPENEFKLELSPLEKPVVQADNKFGIKLFQKLVETDGNVNLLLINQLNLIGLILYN